MVENDYTAMYTLMIFYIILALAGTAGGVIVAKYAEKKTEAYRVNQEI